MCAYKTGISLETGIPKIPEDGKFPKLGKFPNLGNFLGIPVWKIPGRENFEAIQEGGNGNFPLNIPAPT